MHISGGPGSGLPGHKFRPIVVVVEDVAGLVAVVVDCVVDVVEDVTVAVVVDCAEVVVEDVVAGLVAVVVDCAVVVVEDVVATLVAATVVVALPLDDFGALPLAGFALLTLPPLPPPLDPYGLAPFAFSISSGDIDIDS